MSANEPNPSPASASPRTAPAPSTRQPWLIAVLLGLLTVALYWPAVHHEFLNYDDNAYITENPLVQHGLTLLSIKWELLSPVSGNWHPVTMLSHMLDCQLYGLSAGGHHFTNLVFHALNSALLFIFLRRLTDALWRSAFVAACFACHPLHVESVAWVSERKDVLSTFFGLLSLLAYVRYARGREQAPAAGTRSPTRSAPYWLAGIWLALGLLSKPMLVTWPLLFLLLDYWPLNRFQPGRLKPLVNEKIPFFALAAVTATFTLLVQSHSGAMTALARIAWPTRCENALISVCRYLGKLAWPANLSIFYPYNEALPAALVLLAAAFLGVVSWVAIARRRQLPFLPVGWFWFLITLLPVLGLIQVGAQSMADRYTYIPSIGIFICLAWGAAKLAGSIPGRRAFFAIAGALVLVLGGAVTRHQLAYWQNDETLFRHALAVTPDNHVPHVVLGTTFFNQGRLDEAIEQFHAAIRLHPESVEAHTDLGAALLGKGDVTGAIAACQQAVQLAPQFAPAHFNLGVALAHTSQTNEAMNQLRETIRLQPDYYLAHNQLALQLSDRGDTNAAAKEFEESLWLQPGYADGHFNFAGFLAHNGRIDPAISEYLEAARLKPGDPEIRRQLANLYLENGRADAALAQYQQVLRLDPNDAESAYRLGNLYAKAGLKDDAITQFQQAVRLRPDFAAAHNNLGGLLSSLSRLPEAIHEFQEAVRLKPDYADAHYNLGNALFKSGQMGDAISQYETATKLAPNFAPAHFYLGVALARNGRNDEAVPHFQEAIRLKPSDAAAHNRLGLALKEQGHSPEAIAEFQEALRLKPGYLEASNNLAQALAHPSAPAKP